ncbi:MAG: hypothetical protein HETSPECPRED_003512 [Heterodermia speciosa]|uniref:WKF domain-containing protein n=1 Tax=Heterodermia speciosa TaxID=116794 RepID=A0A8H3F3U4_9LECA|nr:MAG: hypothetical protein HETSPECPRED_003512 [Heterodermia speciosa]
MAPVQPAAQHIPAWKRLGLKLKNAKHEPGSPSNPTAAHVQEKSTKRKVVDDGHAEKHAKKAKKSKNTLSSPLPALANGSDQKDDISAVVTQDQSHSVEPESTRITKLPTITKQKSVTFAPEAKTADGDSTKDLYNRWLASQKIADPKYDPTTAAPALKIHSPISKSETSLTTSPPLPEGINVQKKKKKKKKRKSKSKSTTLKPEQSLTSSSQTQPGSLEIATDTQPHPALLYLTEYHTSPPTWKFSKNHQKYLLKNLFSLNKVPSSSESALRAYLSGLKGTSARQSLREEALRLREEDNMWLSEIIAKGRGSEWEAKRKREQYERAWQQEKDRLDEIEDLREWEEGREEFEWKVRKRRRAEQVLGAIGEVETQLAGGVKTSTTGNPDAGARKRRGAASVNGSPMLPAKKKRTRKRRTTGVPDDESSSSSSSSSSSDSDSEDQIDKRLLKGLGIGKRTGKSTTKSVIGRSTIGQKEDETSSSGDSQSSSGDSESSSEP